MKRALFVIAAAFLPHLVFGRELQTRLFFVEVPSEWTVEDNKQSIVLAMGHSEAGEMPTPFLSIQYCASGGVDTGLLKCSEPCSGESLSQMLGGKVGGLAFAPVTVEKAESGETDYRTESSADGKISAVATLVCGANGSVYLSLVAKQPVAASNEIVRAVRKSLRWR